MPMRFREPHRGRSKGRATPGFMQVRRNRSRGGEGNTKRERERERERETTTSLMVDSEQMLRSRRKGGNAVFLDRDIWWGTGMCLPLV